MQHGTRQRVCGCKGEGAEERGGPVTELRAEITVFFVRYSSRLLSGVAGVLLGLLDPNLGLGLGAQSKAMGNKLECTNLFLAAGGELRRELNDLIGVGEVDRIRSGQVKVR